ncbi:MAG: hypothetical protein J6Y20_11310, partial [Lachnospiraceae bacterium]|nr:hypothetical protein [Lachnospiraceae bacterium]
MKKRWMRMISILCVAILLVGILTACDGDVDPEERGKKSGNQNVSVTETPVATPTSEATPTEEPTPEA